MLSNFKLANFKSIKKEANFDFKKLNLFIGPNNSGKTSVLTALGFLLQGKIVEGKLKGKYVDLSNLRDFAFKKNPEAVFEFSLSFSPSKETLKRLSKIASETPLSHFNFSKITLNLKAPVKASEVAYSLSYFSSKVFDGMGELVLGYDHEGGSLVSDKLERTVSSCRLERGLPIISSGNSEIMERWDKFINMLPEQIPEYFFWLKTPRSMGDFPRKLASTEFPEDVGQNGNLTLDVLARIRDQEEYTEVRDKIEKWTSRFGFKEEVIPKLEPGNAYSLNLRDRELNIRANINYMGFGINQLLPVIAQCFYTPLKGGQRREEAIIFIEQPEIHLHPAMQAEVADLFIDASKMGKQLFIETHSEHILLRLQRRIAEDKISAEDVAIFYFEKGKEGTKVKEIKVDETGRYKEKLPGFFEADFEEAVKHMEAVVTRLKKKAADEK